MFAVAAYDADHKLISELGQSAGPVAALLPLPLLHLWCHLALTAAHLGVGTVTHLAASVVLPHFITEEPDCPVWEANPLDRQTINRSATPPSPTDSLHILLPNLLMVRAFDSLCTVVDDLNLLLHNFSNV